jgi:hypothetical protein
MSVRKIALVAENLAAKNSVQNGRSNGFSVQIEEFAGHLNR